MQSIHPEVESRRTELFDAFMALFFGLHMAMRDADADEVPMTPDWRVKLDVELTDEQRESAAKLNEAWANFDEATTEQTTVAAQYLAAVAAMPRSTYDACVQVASFQLDYETGAAAFAIALEEWRKLDTLTGRVRSGVVKRLMDVEGVSATAADKAASGDAEYTTHKDACAAASAKKDQAELERDVLYQKLVTSRELLRALVQVSEARAGRVVVQRKSDPTEPRGTRPDPV